MTSSHQHDTQFSKSSLKQISSFLPSSTSLSSSRSDESSSRKNPAHVISTNGNGYGYGITGGARTGNILKSGATTMSTSNNNSNINGYNNTSSSRIKPLSPSARKLARQKAIEEADAVSAALDPETSRRLENFNLLGVVTSPRILEDMPGVGNGGIHSSIYGSNGSMHGIGGGGGGGSGGDGDHDKVGNLANNAKANIIDSASVSSAATSATASTLASTSTSAFFNNMSSNLSKEIESLNTTLTSYSKSYLGNFSDHSSLDYHTELGYDSIPKGQIAVEDLPKDLLEIDLTSVEAYLRKCGALAEQLNLRDIQNGNIDDVDVSGRINTDTDHDNDNVGNSDNDNDGDGNGNGEPDEIMQQTQPLDKLNDAKIPGAKPEPAEEENPTKSVPDIFFSPYFDLTDRKTFESLFVLGDDEISDSEQVDHDVKVGNGNGLDTTTDATYASSYSNDPIIRIQRPDKLTHHLDTIELALLNQVRSKSSSFFRETNRFTYLKSLVAESVQEVQSLRSQLGTIRERSITDAELIPVMDRRRNDAKLLGEVLDKIMEVVEVKSSVGGLIASGDYLGAVDAIHKARRLLNGDRSDTTNDNDYDNDNKNGYHGSKQNREKHVLRKITALNKINDQLTQYEDLVVMDLSNELVESFLSWNGRSTGELLGNNNFSGMGNLQGAKVKHTILAMKKCGKLSTMADIYREKLCNTIHVTIRTTVTECAADAAKETSLNPAASATIVSIPDKSNARKESKDDSGTPKSSIIEGVTSMSFDQFMECLDMIYEHTLSLLKSAAGVNKFCLEEGISFKDDETVEDKLGDDTLKSNVNSSSTPSALTTGADLSHRSISDILRLRKDTHSLITFEEMRRLWDSCIAFTLQLERISGQKAYVLRSTLLSQAKAFIERKHEANMSSLAAALDSERWIQCDVSAERQTMLDRLCSGRAVLSTRDKMIFGDEQSEKSQVATVEGKRYRVVWSCLLLIEMIMSNVACAAHFQTLATSVVGKVSELLRLFNSRATQLVLGAGAIHSSARLKSINAKHLALVTQCVGVVQSILPHVRAALMAQLPSRQEPLLVELDRIKKEYAEHHDKVLSKFVSIIGGIVEHSLISRIKNTNFDERSKIRAEGKTIECCPFLDGVITNTRKMHQVLVSLLPQEDLIDVFSRIFAHLDSTIPKIFLVQDSKVEANFSLPDSVEGKTRLIFEVEAMTNTLNGLPNVRPWDFGAMKFLSRRLEIDADKALSVTEEELKQISEPIENPKQPESLTEHQDLKGASIETPEQEDDTTSDSTIHEGKGKAHDDEKGNENGSHHEKEVVEIAYPQEQLDNVSDENSAVKKEVPDPILAEKAGANNEAKLED